MQRRLDRTRLLVRAGPAIGLMGTLIPLAPGLGGARRRRRRQLAENLRDAFGATVVGLLVGTVAFALTLARTRMYTEDLAALEQGPSVAPCAPAPSRALSRDGVAAMSRIGLGRHGKIEENAGDPLDGLVNLFDIGIVLAVAFLIAGLTLSVNPRAARSSAARRATAAKAHVLPQPSGGRRARGRGQPVGTAYRLADGRLVDRLPALAEARR